VANPDERLSSYLHGAGAAEQQRLEAQAMLLGGAAFLPPLQPEMRLLELGCGTGAITREVARALPAGQVIGLDQSDDQLATATALAAGEGLTSVAFQRGDAHQLPWPAGSFDGVYCRFLLEHVADPLLVIQEMHRVARPGGWACAYEWEAGCIVNYPDSPAITQVWQSIYAWQHLQGGDPWVGRKLYALFTRSGFSHVEAGGRSWTITGAPREAELLATYIAGAREIIRQTRAGLLTAGLVAPELLQQADEEYQRLLESPDTFIFHGFCRVVGVK
jgi:ubiquinone/menaquinone biosynthesis C-methylase UbiE